MGEQEAATGTADVRTRDNKRHGKIRIDKIAEMLKSEEPAPAKKFDTFYEKAFDPKAFFGFVKEEIKSQSQSSGAQRAAAP